jgi:transposase
VQQAADKATYERRAMAVERERSIAENELQNQIELARREEQLVNQRGQNERMRATEAAAAGQIETQAAASRQRALAEAEADAKRVIGAAEAAAEKALLEAYAELDQATILALAIKQGALPEIGTLNVTPDLITPLLTRLAEQR